MSIAAGADFGTLSVRVTLLGSERGRLGTATAPYELHRRRDDPDFATQSHEEQMTALAAAMHAVLEQAGVRGADVVAADRCIGLVPWMLNQSAHGDGEFGFIATRLNLRRKVVVGFWQDVDTVSESAAWSRAAAGWYKSQHLKVARFGDNMREVAVTQGNKVSAEMVFGYSVNGYGVGDLVKRTSAFTDAEVDALVGEYRDSYMLARTTRASARRSRRSTWSSRICTGTLSRAI